MKKIWTIFSVVLLLGLLWPVSARADGIIIPEPPVCDFHPCPPVPIAQLNIRYHHVEVEIEDQVVVTKVDQVFYNPNNWQVEGTYIFPIPTDAVISSFSLWVDGEPVQGEVLDAQQARARYEEIVRTLRDPALLEYAGTGAWQARIFPIPPKGERRVALEYSQVLLSDNGLVEYVYPLSTEKFSKTPLESVSINVEIRSRDPIRAVYSPTNDIEVFRDGVNHVNVGYEELNVLPDRDFALYYSIGESEAFHLLTYRDPSDAGDQDGFFLALLAPKPEADEKVIDKDIILVLDRSGSMEGEKFQQAQDALRYILDTLNDGDRFNIITFSTGVELYARGLKPAEDAREAIPWVDRLSARGNTDINRALLEAAYLTDSERPTYLIFLTDGLPTNGETDSQEILKNFRSAAPENLRLFAFGVGYDVDTFLLDSLSQENHGTSTYVLPDEPLDEELSAFYEKISTPVLTDIELDFGNIRIHDLYPEPLPDLFIGSQIISVGRYRQSGSTDILVSGVIGDKRYEFKYEDQEFPADTRSGSKVMATLPRLWATRKIGYLLNQIRLYGPDQEMIDQIVKLSIRYGIITPYTSYLVTENVALGEAAQNQIAAEEYAELESMPAEPSFGQDAVRKAAGQNDMEGAVSVQSSEFKSTDVVRIVGSRTFVLKDGFWIDTSFDPDKMQPIPVAFLSEDYFRLVRSYPELNGAFALGSQVIVTSGGTAYQVVEEGELVEPLGNLPTPKPLQSLPEVEIPEITKEMEPKPEEDQELTSQQNPSPLPSSDPQSTGAPSCFLGLFPIMFTVYGFVRIKKLSIDKGKMM